MFLVHLLSVCALGSKTLVVLPILPLLFFWHVPCASAICMFSSSSSLIHVYLCCSYLPMFLMRYLMLFIFVSLPALSVLYAPPLILQWCVMQLCAGSLIYCPFPCHVVWCCLCLFSWSLLHMLHMLFLDCVCCFPCCTCLLTCAVLSLLLLFMLSPCFVCW